MPFDDFPDEVSLRFRFHILCVYAQSTLNLASEIAEEGAGNLCEEDKKLFNDLADCLERLSFEAEKLKKRVRHASV